MILTSKINGASIFFPACGAVWDGVLRSFGLVGDWWCSDYQNFDVIGGGPYMAYVFDFPEAYDSVVYTGDLSPRCSGHCIRPICLAPSKYPGTDKIDEILLDQSAVSLEEDLETILKVTIAPAAAALTPIEWKSSDPSVATVEFGKIYAVSQGTAVVSATAGGKTATCSVTVTPSRVSATQAVDLGLSVKWAGWNVGATSPSEAGTLFCWGETSKWALGYSGASRYKFYDRASPSGSPMFTKYVTSASYASDAKYIDGLSVLQPEDDAATANWGPDWRMPTDEEKTELLANTDHVRFVYRGVSGYLFTSKKNGVSIFLPCTGIQTSGGSPEERERLCAFWTSTLRENNSMAFIACNLVNQTGVAPESGFEMDPTAMSWHLGQYRWYGLPVRAVCK